MRAHRLVLLAATLAALTACAAAFTSTPARLFTLTPKDAADPSLPKATFQLLVEAPVASAGLDTPRIAVARTETSIDYLADAAWTDRAPVMLQGLIVQSFEDSRKIVSVGRDTVGLRSDFVLRTELRDFQAEYSTPNASNPDRVRVRLAAKLVAMPRRTIEAGERFEAVAPVQESGVQGVVTAFDVALGQVMQQLVAWVLRTGTRIGIADGASGGSGPRRAR
ncbi:MAG TPA: ABC-type transport auxiliary lipoprotein family protein [Azospirillum sp.]|nr:ABC-type transport auxiliary lipoprotein family protein [Azospirillum sp.]